jgi:hypothetical protein
LEGRRAPGKGPWRRALQSAEHKLPPLGTEPRIARLTNYPMKVDTLQDQSLKACLIEVKRAT